MGYLRRNLDRRRCLAQKRALARNPIPVELGDWLVAASDPPNRGRGKFVRLATASVLPDSGEPAGIFDAAYRLKRTGRLDSHQQIRLARTLRWFERNLPVPRTGNITDRTIFWFRLDAGECIQKVWALVRLLQSDGSEVKMLVSENPGQIVYEDELQLAVRANGQRRWDVRDATPNSLSELESPVA